MAKAILLYRDRMDLPDGTIVEMKIWRLPLASTERPHRLKYSLFFGRKGERIVSYDNERGKGDHRHYGSRSEPYRFIDVDTLIEDFLADIRKERRK